MASPPRLILVDASGYLFRAYHALPKLASARGEPTGALVGVLNMLERLLDEYRPEYLGIVFDAPGPTFRETIDPQYKAHRPAMPEDLRAQTGPLQAIVRAMGLPLLVESGVEADDVIGTLATRAAAAGFDILIATGDKDLAQLVDDRITLVNTMNQQRLDRQGVIDKFGVPPERIVDYLSLMGDSVDNIPGVPGCGPKTAVKWLQEYDSLEGVIAHAGQIKGKVGEQLRAHLDRLPVARTLTTIKRDVPLALAPTDLRRGEPRREELLGWYDRLGLKQSRARLDASGPPVADPPATALPQSPSHETVLDPDALTRWLERLADAELFALDTETTALDPMRAELVGLSFAVLAPAALDSGVDSGDGPGADRTARMPILAAYVPLTHRGPDAPPQLDRAWVLERLRPLLEDPRRAKVGQNLKYDMSVLARHGIALRGIAHDTMLQSYVLDSTAIRHDLDSLAEQYLNHRTIRFEEVAGKGPKQLRFDEVPVADAARYAAEDAEVTLRLHHRLYPRLSASTALARLYREIEMPLVPVLSRLERAGVRIDRERLAAQSHELSARLVELEARAYATAGHRFNMGSPKQIGAIFFEELGLPVIARTPKGAPSTAESVLEQLAEKGYALPEIILQHRGLAKLKSTYTDKLPEMIDPLTGRVHTSYHQAVAATGRLSSSDPNLQNIPIRTEEGRRIRRAFIPAPGHRLLAADYSQIELRLMAHLSRDARLLDAFASGQDIHRATAAEIHATTPEAITTDQRRAAKAINFGLIYGMSAFGLARQLGIERGAAQDYVERYFLRYPGVRDYMERIRTQARQDGYVETLFGRRLHLPDLAHANQNRRAGAERTAINAPLQGTAADIIKRAMIAVDAWIQETQPPVRMILQVHDELVFEVATEALDDATATIRALMEGAATLAVPLVVETGSGDNWDEAH